MTVRSDRVHEESDTAYLRGVQEGRRSRTPFQGCAGAAFPLEVTPEHKAVWAYRELLGSAASVRAQRILVSTGIVDYLQGQLSALQQQPQQAELEQGEDRGLISGVVTRWWSDPPNSRVAATQRRLEAALEDLQLLEAQIQELQAERRAVDAWLRDVNQQLANVVGTMNRTMLSVDPPVWVRVYDDQRAFVEEDLSRRDAFGDAGGEDWGYRWTRHVDDPVAPPREYSWRVSYIQHTRELYAVQLLSESPLCPDPFAGAARSKADKDRDRRQVWLLSSELDAADAHELLPVLEQDQDQANSLMSLIERIGRYNVERRRTAQEVLVESAESWRNELPPRLRPFSADALAIEVIAAVCAADGYEAPLRSITERLAAYRDDPDAAEASPWRVGP